MKTIYSITIQTPAEPALTICRTFHVESHEELLVLTKLVENNPSWKITHTTIDHLMSAREIVDELDQEIDWCMREAHTAAFQ